MTAVAPKRSLRERLHELRNLSRREVMAALLAGVPEKHQPEAFIEELGSLLGFEALSAEQIRQRTARFDLLEFAECASRRCAVLAPSQTYEAKNLLVTDPFDADLVAWARTRFGEIEPALCSDETFDGWLTFSETSVRALRGLASAGESVTNAVDSADAEIVSLRSIGASDSPSVRFVNSTLYDALRAGASDIHLECRPLGMEVKFRLDGVLTAVTTLDDGGLADQVINRIKVMAQLDIAERRIPQDGRLQVSYEQRAIDVRVSVMPSIHGEDAVLRVLDRQHLAASLEGLTLSKLGYDHDTAQMIRALCRKPHGMFLVTGPTGSGKTTTLYAAITETHQSRDKIITIEDPVEYQLSGVLQIPVNEKKGLSFARGLRSILRHDPDKILVGEIRDAETAQIAVQSALTGHLVFTTVHANSVFDVVSRFAQFGIDAYTFASAINGVLAQRLLRRVCPACALPAGAEFVAELAPDLRLEFSRRGADARLLRAVGCQHCRETGYSGRFALGEMLELTPEVKALISARAPLAQIQSEAERGGWRSLRAHAVDVALAGKTTAEEVDRVAV